MQFKSSVMILAIIFAVNSACSANDPIAVEWTGGDSHRQFNVAKTLAGEGGTVLIPQSPTGEPWVLEKRFFMNVPGQTYIFEEGVVLITKSATAGVAPLDQPFGAVSTSLIRVLADDVSIVGEGSGATLAMRKDQFENPDLYVTSDFRNCLLVSGVNNFRIENMTIRDTGADGIIVTRGPAQPFSTATIRNVRCENCRRNGLSIVSTTNCLVERSSFDNSNGALPEAGIDIEPDDENDFCEGVVIRNCAMRNNGRKDLDIALFNFHAEPGEPTFEKPIDILIERCWTNGSPMYGCFVSGCRDVENGVEIDPPTNGQIRLRNCAFLNAGENEVRLRGVRHDWVPVIFENLYVKSGPSDVGFPITFSGYRKFGQGNVHFEGNCFVNDCVDRTVITVGDADSSDAAPVLSNITGSLDVATPFTARSELGDDVEDVSLTVRHNLIKNSGFEYWRVGWSDLGGAKFSGDAFAGDIAARLPVRSRGFRQNVTGKIRAGARYRLAAASKAQWGKGAIAVRFIQRNGRILEQHSIPIESSGYEVNEVEFDAPKSGFNRVDVLLESRKGSVLVDEVVLSELNP